jgi:hypothetical protein
MGNKRRRQRSGRVNRRMLYEALAQALEIPNGDLWVEEKARA